MFPAVPRTGRLVKNSAVAVVLKGRSFEALREIAGPARLTAFPLNP